MGYLFWLLCGLGDQAGASKLIPPPPAQVRRFPPSQPYALLHLHVENRLLVPILPTIPDRQGIIAPLQVKLLEGQLDHLGREHGIRGQVGAARRDFQSLEDSKKFPCYVLRPRVPMTPFHMILNPN